MSITYEAVNALSVKTLAFDPADQR